MMRPTVLAAILVFGLAGSAASATVVSGRVTTTGGSGIANVDLDFIDRDTDQSVPLVNDDTDILGFYAVSVPAGDYDIRFKPQSGDRFVAIELRGERVEGGAMTLDQDLDSGWFVSGRILDPGSIPIALLDLDFNDLIDGAPIFIAHDGTDVAGNFNVVMPTGTFSIEIEPPIGSTLVPQLIDNLVVTSDTALGDLALLQGFHLSGNVVDSGALPVIAAEVQTLDPGTGGEIFNIRNNTDLVGLFDLVVAPAPYSMLIIPQRGESVLPRLLGGVDVQADLALPTITLDAGALVTGLVTDASSNAAEAVDLDFVSSFSGIERFTPKDNTDPDGLYAIAVPPGTYDINFTPPPNSGLASAELIGVVIGGSGPLPTVQLQTARTVSGVVRDGIGNPLPGVDLDFLQSIGGAEQPSVGDTTDATGSFSAIVASGTYDVEFNPVAGSGFGQTTVINVSVSGSVNLGTVTLPNASTGSAGSINPPSGTAGGGSMVTVTGSGFAPGVKVFVGGRALSDVVLTGTTSIQGTTRPHPTGAVDVEVINPGAPGTVLPAAFTYVTSVGDPVLTLGKTGPLATDILLEWTNTGNPTYSVFRTLDPERFTDAEVIGVQTGTSLRDDAAATAQSPALEYYRVQ